MGIKTSNLILLHLVFVLPYCLLYFVHYDYLTIVYLEDGFVEWLSFFAWFGAGIIFLLLFIKCLRSCDYLKAFWILVLTAVTLIAAGEEISWGQRILGYETPAAVESVNLQQEMNLHNMKWLDVRVEAGGGRKTGVARWLTFNRLGALFWLGFLVILPVGCLLSDPFKRVVNRCEIPVVALYISLLAVVNYLMYVLLKNTSFLSVRDLPRYALDEYKEAAVALLFFLAAVYLRSNRSTDR